MDIHERSLLRHRETQGKIGVTSRMRLESQDDLSIADTPGVARPCEEIAKNPGAAWDRTWKGRTVAVVFDGSAVLGPADIGPKAALPETEGKAALFAEFADIDAVPVVVDAREIEDIVAIVRVAPTCGDINLEGFSAPRCFAIEIQLQDICIPVLHDDQHGTAMVLLAAIRNAARCLGPSLSELSVVINGAGAAGRALAHLLTPQEVSQQATAVQEVVIADSRGILHSGKQGSGPLKKELA